MVRPSKASEPEDELATRRPAPSRNELDDGDDHLDELSSDGSEDPRHWERYWSNWT